MSPRKKPPRKAAEPSSGDWKHPDKYAYDEATTYRFPDGTRVYLDQNGKLVIDKSECEDGASDLDDFAPS